MHCLMVEDDPLMRHLILRMLNRHGTAENGKVAHNLLRDAWLAKEEGRYVCVFLDNPMHIKNGIEVSQEVRRIGMRTFSTGNPL